jgi:hypothetical protein
MDRTRRTNRQPLDEQEWALNRLRHTPPGGMPQRRGSSCGIQFFCITPIQAALNGFWDLSRHLSRLDKSQKPLHTIRDRGDAEATSVRTSPTANHQAAHPKQGDPTQPKPARAAPRRTPAKSMTTASLRQAAKLRNRDFANHRADPRPTQGATALFNPMPVKPPMGGLPGICGQPAKLRTVGLAP